MEIKRAELNDRLLVLYFEEGSIYDINLDTSEANFNGISVDVNIDTKILEAEIDSIIENPHKYFLTKIEFLRSDGIGYGLQFYKNDYTKSQYQKMAEQYNCFLESFQNEKLQYILFLQLDRDYY